jgi:DNA-binding response OmpR family regulator
MRQILLVTFSDRGPARKELLERAGHEVIVARAAPRAIELLARHSPDLLISEIRLGAINGLYLVIRHQETHPGMQAILIDESYDRVLARDARRYQGAYLTEPLDEATLLAQVSGSVARRRWPRKRLGGRMVAEVQDQSALVLDLSYGGLRLEIPETHDVPSQSFPVVFPARGMTIHARAVWSRPSASGATWCGAERSDGDAMSETEWRDLVDSVRG